MKLGRAFTFVELMIVMTIIAILAAIAVPNFLEASMRSRVARARAELASVKMAMEAYRQEARAWPLNRKAGTPDGWDLAVLTTPVAYMVNLPLDVMTEPDGRGQRPVTVKPLPYRYLNGVQIDPDRGVSVVDPGVSLGGGFIAGALWGFGPGGLSVGALKDPPTRVVRKAEMEMTAYDPSNGTTSRGDIYQRVP